MKHYRKNPRQITEKQFKQLGEWLEVYGDLSGIVHNIRTDEIVGGNQRAEAMHFMNGTKPVIEHRYRKPNKQGTVAEGYFEYKGERFHYRQVDWPPRKAEAANVIANKAGGSWDWDILANEFEVPDLLNWGFDERELLGAGFDMGEEIQDAEPQIEVDRFEEVAKKWGTKLNQLWRAGNHLIYCGDSLNPESIKFLFNGKKPSLVIADPPYGVSIVAANVSIGGGESEKGMIPFGGIKKKRGYVGGGAAIKARTGFYPIEMRGLRGTVGASKPFGSKAVRGSDGATHIVKAGKYPVIIGDEDINTAKEAVKLYRNFFPDCVQVWWGANYYSDVLPPSQCWLVWNKETTGNFADCELAWTNQNKSARLFTHRWNGMLRDSERDRRWHPTQKPALLAAWVFEGFSQEDAEIFDPFGGAGWSMLAAEMCNRKARVIEKSPEYVAVCLERMSMKFPDLKIERIE